MTEEPTLYERLGGYDAITAVVENLLPRLVEDPGLGRFWAHRGEDGVRREKQLLIDFLCARSGGPVYYTGRDMATSHRGMGISAGDWEAFMKHVAQTLQHFSLPDREREEVLAFIESTKHDIVE